MNKIKKQIVGVIAWTVLFCFGFLPSPPAFDISDQAPASVTVDNHQDLQAEIEQMRAEIRANGWNFTVGDNPAMKYSLEDLCGTDPNRMPPFSAASEPGDAGSQISVEAAANLPTSYTGYCTPVKDQAKCGSCWAFATIGNLEAAILKKTGLTVDLSEQFLVSCNPWGWGCDGGNFAYDMLVPSNKYYPGAMPESCFPYTATDAKCAFCTSPPWYPVSKWGYVTTAHTVPSVEAIKNAIFTYGSVSVYIHAGMTFQAYTGGVYNTARKSFTTNHSVVLCGWNDSQQAWLLKNSWGTGWGIKGFMWIAYNCPDLVGQGTSWVTID